MNCNFEREIPPSKAIQHMQLRLSVKQVSSIDVHKKTFENSDKMIEHIRIRLKASSQLSHRNVFSP